MTMVYSLTVTLLYVCITVAIQDSYIENLQNWKSNDNKDICRRTCQVETPPMMCQYKFEIEWYHTLTEDCRDCPNNFTDCYRKDCVPGDGTKRGIVTINRKIPGPSIEACQNDIIIVDVTNKMLTEGTTIHWHGQLQKTCPYMDGVPYVTQCPIQPYNSFRYTFKATQAGTHFWHSHMGMQRVDGAFGPLIVRVPKEQDVHDCLYDFDLSSHIIVINDWGKEVGAKMFLSYFYAGGVSAPINLLVNGFGRFRKMDENSESQYVPSARFKVDKGFRYRFRIINSGSLNCPIEITVDNHVIEVISSDGLDIKPIIATSIVTYAGERFDFILHANQSEDLYWIKFKGLIKCNEKYGSVFQVAVLEYNGFNAPQNRYPKESINYFSAHNDGIQVNPLNKGMESDDFFVPAPRMKAVKKWDESLKSHPDFQYYVGFDFNNISHSDYHREHYEDLNVKNPLRVLTPQFNHISMLWPSFPILPQREQIDDKIFCNSETMEGKNCHRLHCQCLHRIKIPLDAVVELVFVDEGFSFEGSHPIHLHGYTFRIIAMERMGSKVKVEEVKEKDARGLIRRNLVDAPLKDTVTVPDGGYTIVRFVAHNPGYWILHCHIEVHMALGMAMILQVGEQNDMLPVPENFPKCGHYAPNIITSIANIQKNSAKYIQSNLILYILWPLVLTFYNN